ncbi:hypothetical protein SEPCBS57363_005155 [Sporothrix epigloea]|uniref:Zn(2)-C6 fungal-type domain-containing protein n=1 Tax=Sporothrix epigloea TaxID=1892477 RepID=A0ABP0DX72_9PEZI
MVGVPRSRGCLLCVRRRVRCDEGRPGCAKCATYRVECPGYDRSLKFVAGKHQVRKRGQGRDRRDPSASEGSAIPAATPVLDTGFSAHQEANCLSSDKPPRGSRGTCNVIVPVFFDLSSPWTPPYGIPPSPRDGRAAYVNTILEMVNMDQPKETLFYGSWFNQVPDRLGRKLTLDSAVCSFAMHLLGKSRGDKVLVMQSRQLYGQSLAALQAALNHPVEWRSSETLCTTMVMCLYELFADTSKASTGWLQHSSAVASLIQHRGVSGFVEHWDKAMFFSFRSIIIMNAFFTGRDCFLAKKKWQRLLFSSANSNFYSLASPAGDAVPSDAGSIIDQHVAHLAHLPHVMRHGWEIRSTRQHGLPVDLAQVAMLQRSATRLHASFCTWYADASTYLGDPVFITVPSNWLKDTPPSPYTTVLQYPDPWRASVYLSYVASMLIIQESLNQCVAVRAELLMAQTQTARAGAQCPSIPNHTATSTQAAVADAAFCVGCVAGSDSLRPPDSTLPETALPESDTASLDSASPNPVLVIDQASIDRLAAVSPPHLRPYDASNRKLCRIIFRSFEMLSAGLMGQYRIGFSMRVAYEFADVPTQLWIRTLLDRSVKTFASSRADSYPPVKPNEFNYN